MVTNQTVCKNEKKAFVDKQMQILMIEVNIIILNLNLKLFYKMNEVIFSAFEQLILINQTVILTLRSSSSPNMYQCFKIEGIFYCEQLVIRAYTGANKNTECLQQ